MSSPARDQQGARDQPRHRHHQQSHAERDLDVRLHGDPGVEAAQEANTPRNADGIDPSISQATRPRWTVPRRQRTAPPIGFITMAATMSGSTPRPAARRDTASPGSASSARRLPTPGQSDDEPDEESTGYDEGGRAPVSGFTQLESQSEVRHSSGNRSKTGQGLPVGAHGLTGMPVGAARFVARALAISPPGKNGRTSSKRSRFQPPGMPRIAGYPGYWSPVPDILPATCRTPGDTTFTAPPGPCDSSSLVGSFSSP